MNKLSLDKKRQVILALIEGNSVRSIERMTGVHRDTIIRLMKRVGASCKKILDEKMKDLDCESIQIDEIWTFVKKKQKQVNDIERMTRKDIGDQYVFVALDAKTKLVPSFKVGKRTSDTTYEFMSDLKSRLNGNKPQITTDGFPPYPEAMETKIILFKLRHYLPPLFKVRSFISQIKFFPTPMFFSHNSW